MSYAICRVQKIGGSKDIAGVQLHNRRERTHSNTNPDIDFTRSSDNYTLKDTSSKSYNTIIDELIKNGYTGKKNVRKDAVKLCEALFTSDNEFFSKISSEQQKSYFEDCYAFACEKYGKENIISATIHLDELTPHMHVDFVPLTADGRLSAKEVLGGRPDLQKLQDDFYKAVGEKYGLERGKRTDINDMPTRKHERVAEYKASTEYYQQQKSTLESDVQALQATKEKLNDILHTEPQNAIQSVSVPSVAKLAIGKENKDKVLVSPTDIEQLQELAKAIAVTASDIDSRSSDLDEREQQLSEKENKLKTKENEVYIKEEKAGELLLLAEEATQAVEEYEKERKQFYEESTPYIQQLIEERDKIEEKLNQQDRIFYNINKENKSEKDKLRTKINELQVKIDEIKPLIEEKNYLKEQILALENQKQENINKIDSLIKQNDETQTELDRINKLYDTVWECAEYISDRVKIDFDKFVDKRIEGYRLNYILENGIAK